MSRIAIEKAREICQKYPTMEYPVDAEFLACSEGCICVKWPFLKPVKEVKRGRWIGISQYVDASERRYLIAHALAHHLLHNGNQLAFRLYREVNCHRQEKEADCCAAHILMPEGKLEDFVHLPLWEIAQYFGVPEDLVKQRLTVFATEDEIKRWNKLDIGGNYA
jgi:Zn-dependent peptidase ImmA (M78 family)